MTCRPRFGVAAVELAVTLPVFVLIVLASIDLSSRINLKQSCTTAAYEGARCWSAMGGDLRSCENAIIQLMESKGIESWNYSTSPSGPTPRGTMLTVTVEVPYSNNVPIHVLSGSKTSATAFFVKQ